MGIESSATNPFLPAGLCPSKFLPGEMRRHQISKSLFAFRPGWVMKGREATLHGFQPSGESSWL
jgi:hypothetical protein